MSSKRKLIIEQPRSIIRAIENRAKAESISISDWIEIACRNELVLGAVVRRRVRIMDIEALNATEHKILRLIVASRFGGLTWQALKPRITIAKLANVLNCSESTVKRGLRLLVARGFVKFEGAPKTGSYTVGPIVTGKNVLRILKEHGISGLGIRDALKRLSDNS